MCCCILRSALHDSVSSWITLGTALCVHSVTLYFSVVYPFDTAVCNGEERKKEEEAYSFHSVKDTDYDWMLHNYSLQHASFNVTNVPNFRQCDLQIKRSPNGTWE